MSIDHPDYKERRRFVDPGEIDPRLWEDLSCREVNKVCVRASVQFDRKRDCYRVPFLNRMYAVLPRERRIDPWYHRGEERLSFQFYLVLITYLLRAQSLGLSGRMVTGAELRGGAFFFRGNHALFTGPLEQRFGSDPKAFLEAGLRLGGGKTNFGDASFRLWPLPRVPLGYMLWSTDEEFPARVVVVFDASIVGHLPLDVIWAMVNEVGGNLLEEAGSLRQKA
jgi:hypothetical protein